MSEIVAAIMGHGFTYRGRAPQSAGGNTMGQNWGAGWSNSKATAECPAWEVSTRTTWQLCSCLDLSLIRRKGWPTLTSMRNFSSPPCALTTTVCVSSRTSLPSRVLACTTTGTCSITRSLRRRSAGLVAVTFVSTIYLIPHYIVEDLQGRDD